MTAMLFICHPRLESLTYRFAKLAQEILANYGDVKVVDVYRDGIDPFLTPVQSASYDDGAVYPEVTDVMASVRQSSTLCFVFPVWMYGIASPLKGVLEKLVRPGITFRIKPDGVSPLLTNIERLGVICTSGQAAGLAVDEGDPVEYSFRRLKEDNFSTDCRYVYLRLFGADHITLGKIEAFERKIESQLEALLAA